MIAPKIPSFFKTKKPNQFYFEPRYYNERKEKMQQRYERIAKELDQEKSNEKTSSEVFRSTLRESWGANRKRKAGINYKVMFYIVILSGLAYYYLAN